MRSIDFVGLIPAAGTGERALGCAPSTQNVCPKQYRPLLGRCMLSWAIAGLFCDDRISRVFIAVSADDIWINPLLEQEWEGHANFSRIVVLRTGGSNRTETVLNSLNALQYVLAPDDWVLVHDAARPGLPSAVLQTLINACAFEDVGGLLALPINDTLKLAQEFQDPGQFIEKTISRERVWAAQTPQMFRFELLRKALLSVYESPVEITDEASAIERMGFKPKLVRGSARNFKVTWPEDFELMEKWLEPK